MIPEISGEGAGTVGDVDPMHKAKPREAEESDGRVVVKVVGKSLCGEFGGGRDWTLRWYSLAIPL
jgi:hypothetical protein